MTPSDKIDFAQYMTKVLAFQKQDASKFALDVWWAACQPFDMEQVKVALTAHIVDPDRGQFAITPADVVRKLMGTKVDRARIAWGKTFDAMQGVGAYQSVVFDDPVIHCCVEDLGGWIALCRSDLDELSHTERRFCDAYRAYSARPGGLGEFPARLAGCYEIDNRSEGRKVAPPVLVGDPIKAAEVLRLGGAGAKTQFTLASAALVRLGHEGQAA